MAYSSPLALRLTKRLEQAKALDGASDRAEDILSKLLDDGKMRGLLAGDWMGHALHPLLTDVPVGAWTSSLILDLLGGPSAERAADLLIGVGVAAVLPTALTGWSDWGEAGVEERRVGLAHAGANISATAFFAGSLMGRRKGRRGIGKTLSLVGAGMLSLGGYMGGHLAYVRGVGVGERRRSS